MTDNNSTTKAQSTTTKLEISEPTLEPCPLNHYVSAGLKAYKTGHDPRVVCLDCGLTLCAPDWTTVYERWQSRARISANGVPTVDGADRTRCASCRHEFCKECNELDECCKCDTEIPPRTVAERLAQHEHVEVVEGVLGGVNPLVSRRRISVHHILSYLYNGESINDIVENYKLTPEAIKDAIAFAQDVYDDTIDAALRNPAASPVAPVEQIDEVANRVNAAIARMDTSQKVDAATMALEINPVPAPSAAIQDEAPTFRSTKEAMLYAQRHGIPSVIPAKSPYSEGVDDAARVARVLNKVESAPSGLPAFERLSTREAESMKNYDDFRAGMLRAAEMARNEFKRAPDAAKGHDCVYMGGYEDACDHLSAVIAQAAVIDSVRIAGPQPDWQYHISLLLPDDIEDAALLKIYQVVEHELRAATPLSSLARKAAEEWFVSRGEKYPEAQPAIDELTEIIERCLSEGES